MQVFMRHSERPPAPPTTSPCSPVTIALALFITRRSPSRTLLFPASIPPTYGRSRSPARSALLPLAPAALASTPAEFFEQPTFQARLRRNARRATLLPAAPTQQRIQQPPVCCQAFIHQSTTLLPLLYESLQLASRPHFRSSLEPRYICQRVPLLSHFQQPLIGSMSPFTGARSHHGWLLKKRITGRICFSVLRAATVVHVL